MNRMELVYEPEIRPGMTRAELLFEAALVLGSPDVDLLGQVRRLPGAMLRILRTARLREINAHPGVLTFDEQGAPVLDGKPVPPMTILYACTSFHLPCSRWWPWATVRCDRYGLTTARAVWAWQTAYKEHSK